MNESIPFKWSTSHLCFEAYLLDLNNLISIKDLQTACLCFAQILIKKTDKNRKTKK